MKKLIAVQVLVTVALLGLNFMPSAGATTEGHKFYVCKYVGPPASPNETLQGGDNPIFVDEHSIDTYPNVQVGDEFADGQDQSVVIAGPYDSALEVEPTCPTTPATSTVPPPPPPTTTVPPPPPPTTTVTVPPTTTTPPPPPPACKGSVALGPWYGDPRINITLTGSGHFVVSGGIQRTTNTTTFDKTLACGEVFKIGRYKVEHGHYLTITLNSVLVTHIKPPRIHRH